MTHAELVKIAGRWLLNTRKCGVDITEMGSGSPEHPDAIGWKERHSTLVECKASRSDFLADKSKWFRKIDGQAMGGSRLFMAEPGVIRADELPEGWGLLEVRGQRVFVIRNGNSFKLRPSDRAYEIQILSSALRRMVTTTGVRGINCRVYVSDTGSEGARAEILTAQPPPEKVT